MDIHLSNQCCSTQILAINSVPDGHSDQPAVSNDELYFVGRHHSDSSGDKQLAGWIYLYGTCAHCCSRSEIQSSESH